jgi:hypothetical protein
MAESSKPTVGDFRSSGVHSSMRIIRQKLDVRIKRSGTIELVLML